MQYRGGRCPRSGQSFRPDSVGWQRAATPSQSAREPRRFRFPLHSVKSLPHKPGQNTRVPSAACLQTEVTLQAYCCALFSFAASSQWMRSDLYLSFRESFQHAFRLFSSSLPRPLAAAAREFPRIRVLVPRHRGGLVRKGRISVTPKSLLFPVILRRQVPGWCVPP